MRSGLLLPADISSRAASTKALNVGQKRTAVIGAFRLNNQDHGSSQLDRSL
jgi:hypothetical protein